MKQVITKLVIVFLSTALIPLCAVCNASFSTYNSKTFVVYDISSEKTISLSEKEYLIGALFAEIDPNYNPEVLKAQTIIAYTNAMFEKNTSSKNYDFEIDISREILYIDEETAKNKYKENYDSLLDKVKKAVDSVYGKSITSDSKTVLLPYFAYSNGFTEDAYTVWGQDIKYLKPVKSAGDLLNPNAKTTYSFSIETIRTLVHEKYKVELPEDATDCFSVANRSNSGTVTACNVGTIVMTGQDFRSLLGLCSANFDLSCDETTLTVICYGNGHCVGMSQYGADFMARQGGSYIDILTHYYTGIEIT